MTTEYKFSIGLWKSLKNTAIVVGVPMVLYLINTWQNWMPSQYNAVALPIFGFLSYLVKNFVENK